MRAHCKYFAKGILLTVLLIAFLLVLTKVFVPKYHYNTSWSVTATYQGFYELKKNTADVLFFGSSHAASSFNMQHLYNEYGITGYNLGCEQQNLLVSYYWLKEALRFQSPKAVVLDLFILFEYNKEEPLNSSESCARKALDYMKWSPVKVAAVKEICEIDENQTALSYYLPNIRFHTRWTELSEDDFTSDLSTHYELKGFCPLVRRSNYKDYVPFTAGTSEKKVKPVNEMAHYLDKIIELCDAEDIQLILVKTPTTETNIGKYNTVQKIAEKNGIEYYDFNETKLYHKLGFDFPIDMRDEEHGSVPGSIKITDFLGDILANKYGISKQFDVQWEETRDFYEGVLREYNIFYATDIYEYLNLIDNERYSIFISVKEDAAFALNEKIIALMNQLGLDFKLEGQRRASYLAVITAEGQYEEVGDEQLEYCGTIRNGAVPFEIVSAGAKCGDRSSIIIDGVEHGRNQRGLNIVVYDNLLKKRIDSVAFDTSVPEFTAVR